MSWIILLVIALYVPGLWFVFAMARAAKRGDDMSDALWERHHGRDGAR